MNLGMLTDEQATKQRGAETLEEIRRLISIGETGAADELARDQPPQVRRSVASQVGVRDASRVKIAALGALWPPGTVASVRSMTERRQAAQRRAAGCGIPGCRRCKPAAAR